MCVHCTLYSNRIVSLSQVATSSEYKSREANVWPKNKPEFKNALLKAFDLRYYNTKF